MSVVKVKGGVFTEESQKHLLNVWVMQDYIYLFLSIKKKNKWQVHSNFFFVFMLVLYSFFVWGEGDI